jgi:predicted Fe-S protein YdhL (DUF1289 family)
MTESENVRDEYEKILDRQAQAVLDTCFFNQCALCKRIAKDVRNWRNIPDQEKIATAELLLVKVAGDFQEVFEEDFRRQISNELKTAAIEARKLETTDIDANTLFLASEYVLGKG